MKIKSIHVYYLNIPLTSPLTLFGEKLTKAKNFLIEVQTNDGIRGIGEGSPLQSITGETQESCIFLAQKIKKRLLGMNCFAIEEISALLSKHTQTSSSVSAAFDMALYDILGKAHNLPLFRLLGGGKSSFETDITIGRDDPERMSMAARIAVQKGYRTLKLKVGGSPELDIARVKAVRNTVGEKVTIRIDVNQRWSVKQAIDTIDKMGKYQIQLVEQPVAKEDIAGMKRIKKKTLIPIMADESLFSPSDAIDLIKNDTCDFFNIKLMKSGGLNRSLKIMNIAEAANINCMVGCILESRLGLTAASHLVASQSRSIIADLDSNMLHAVDPVIGGITFKKNIITIPEKPGLGVEVDRRFISRV